MTASVSAQQMTVKLTPEAMRYAEQVIGPILVKAVNNPSEIPGIRNRIRAFSDQKQAEKLLYLAADSFSPVNRDHFAHVDYDRTARKPVVILYVPRAKEVLKLYGKEVFETETLIAFTHEMIHIKQQDEFGPISARQFRNFSAADQIEEACAYGKTVLEIIQPLLQSGRPVAPNHMANVAAFKVVGNNCRDLRWVVNFSLRPSK